MGNGVCPFTVADLAQLQFHLFLLLLSFSAPVDMPFPTFSSKYCTLLVTSLANILALNSIHLHAFMTLNLHATLCSLVSHR